MKNAAANIYETAKAGLSHLLWPARCLNCSNRIQEADKALCRNCWDSLSAGLGGDYCPSCGGDVSKYGLVNNRCPDCINNDKFYFDGIVRAGIYTAPLSKMIIDFKLADKTELDAVFSLLTNSVLQTAAFFAGVDYIVPVPIHWTTRIARGYNHARLIAETIKHPTAKVNTELVKIRRTKDQSQISTPSKRLANVRDAFAVCNGHDFAGKRICLIDDIKTSGATLNECAKTLKDAGAEKIYGFVLAVVMYGK